MRTLIVLLLIPAILLAGKNESAPVDAPYNKVFEPHRACWEAKDLAKRGAPDALRTLFLAAYVRVNQPFLGGEDFDVMNQVYDDVIATIGDERFARSLTKERPEIRSAVGWFMARHTRMKHCPQTAKVFRDAPEIDWPLDRAFRNDR
jgi:hypothetical protein